MATPNTYKPGQSVTLSASFAQGGVLTNVSPVLIQVVSPDGVVQATQATLSVLNPSAGNYTAVFAIPLTAPVGQRAWWYRFWTTSVTPSLNGLGEQAFFVAPLAY